MNDSAIWLVKKESYKCIAYLHLKEYANLQLSQSNLNSTGHRHSIHIVKRNAKTESMGPFNKLRPLCYLRCLMQDIQGSMDYK